MKRHLNTLFVTTEDAWIVKRDHAIAVRVENETRLHIPLHNLGGICCFGRVQLTQPAMAACAAEGISISMLSASGRFQARITGPTSGNVLLRRQQYTSSDDGESCCEIAKNFIYGKIANSRGVLLRRLRDNPDTSGKTQLKSAITQLGQTLDILKSLQNLDEIRGAEGDAARIYFDVFSHLISTNKDCFNFTERSRRPPKDAVNALLSFLYSMLTHDSLAACEAVGLDTQVGFLHRQRPGRPSLALDLMEELRSFLADRLALSLINRRQVNPKGFITTESGAVQMDDKTRKTVISAYQKRKNATIIHPFINEKTTIGLIVHLQARLLARHLRGDMDGYPPFLWK